MAWKKQNLAPMWKKLMKLCWYWGANIISWSRLLRMHSTGMQKQTRKSLDNTTKCLNPVFLLEQPKNYQNGTNLAQKLQRGPATWKDMLENAWNGIANWQTRRQSNFSRCLVLAWTITKSKKEDLENKGELWEVCSHVVLEWIIVPDTDW